MSKRRLCSKCLVTAAIKPGAAPTGWWHFNKYTTKKGNTYTGTFCPKCSDKVYAENES